MRNNEWIKLINENMEEIKKLGLEMYRDRYNHPGLQGWHLGVEISEDGSVYSLGPLSSGSSAMTSYQGDSLEVIHLPIQEYEFNDPIESYLDDMEDLGEFERYIVDEYSIDRDDYETVGEYQSEIEYYMALDKYAEFNPAKYQEFYNESLEMDISEYGPSYVEDKIDQTLQTLADTMDECDF